MKRAMTVVVALATGLSAVATGCSSSTKANPPVGAPSTTGANKPDINVMQVAIAPVPGYSNVEAPVVAAFDAINAKGGIDGHKVNLIHCDAGSAASGGSAASVTTCAMQAVQDHVVALVGTYTAFSTLLYPTIQPAGIPNLNLALTPADNTNALSYPVGPSVSGVFFGVGLMMTQQLGCKKVGLISFGPASAADPTIGKPLIDAVKAGGGSMATTVYVATTATDVTAAVAQVEAANPDCIVPATLGPQIPPVLQAIHSSGKTYKIGSNDAYVPASLLQSATGSLANGFYASSSFYPISSVVDGGFATPGETQMLNELQTYQPNYAKSDPALTEMWTSAQLFIAAATAAGANGQAITSASVKAALDQECNYNSGVLPVLNFCETPPVPGLPRIRDFASYEEQVQNQKLHLVSQTPIDMSQAMANSGLFPPA